MDETHDELMSLLPTMGDARAVWERHSLRTNPGEDIWPVAVALLRLERRNQALTFWHSTAADTIERQSARIAELENENERLRTHEKG